MSNRYKPKYQSHQYIRYIDIIEDKPFDNGILKMGRLVTTARR